MGEGTTEGKRYHAVEDGPADRGTDLLGFLLSQQWQVPAKGAWEDKAQKSSGIRDTRASEGQGAGVLKQECLEVYKRGN